MIITYGAIRNCVDKDHTPCFVQPDPYLYDIPPERLHFQISIDRFTRNTKSVKKHIRTFSS